MIDASGSLGVVAARVALKGEFHILTGKQDDRTVEVDADFDDVRRQWHDG